MTKEQLIEKLDSLRRRTAWEDGMGSCKVSEFITIPEVIKNNEEIMDTLYRTIENINANCLESAAEEINPNSIEEDETPEGRAWEMWTNLEIEFDYSKVQELVNQYAIDME